MPCVQDYRQRTIWYCTHHGFRMVSIAGVIKTGDGQQWHCQPLQALTEEWLLSLAHAAKGGSQTGGAVFEAARSVGVPPLRGPTLQAGEHLQRQPLVDKRLDAQILYPTGQEVVCLPALPAKFGILDTRRGGNQDETVDQIGSGQRHAECNPPTLRVPEEGRAVSQRHEYFCHDRDGDLEGDRAYLRAPVPREIHRDNSDLEQRSQLLERSTMLREPVQGNKTNRPVSELSHGHLPKLGLCFPHRR